MHLHIYSVDTTTFITHIILVTSYNLVFAVDQENFNQAGTAKKRDIIEYFNL